jgi:3-deoxy-D-manno-octulosonic-acid transferase
MLFLYNAALVLGAFFWLPWMIIRTRARKDPPNWAERTGDYSLPPGRNPKRIWVHAVSVGEVVACLPILKEIKSLLPEWEIILSVTTSSGHKTAQEKGKGLVDHLVYFPIDLPRFTLRGLARAKPAAIAIMETELWLNFLWTARQLEIPTLLINGRISDRNAKNSAWIKPYYWTLFQYVNSCLMQTERDRERIEALGAKNPVTVGNCKFDQAIEEGGRSRTEWREELGVGPSELLLVIGSTREAEDEGVVAAGVTTALATRPDVKVVWAPRHPDQRAEPLAERLKSAFGPPAFRSRGETGRVLILDTFGELSSLYAAADLAIVGGSFTNLGGQNIIQPLAHGVPVLHGPSMSNFRDAAELAGREGAAKVCQNETELAASIGELLNNADLRRRMGEAGKALVEASKGAGKAYAEAIAKAAVDAWEKKEEEIRIRDAKKKTKK